MISKTERQCLELLEKGRSANAESINILNDFPFSRWSLLRSLGHGKRNENDPRWKVLIETIDRYESLRNVVSYPVWLRDQYREMLRSYFSMKWTNLDQKMNKNLRQARDSKKMLREMRSAYRDSLETKAMLAFLRASVEVAWLSSFFVFQSREVKILANARHQLIASHHQQSFVLSKKVIEHMKEAYLKAVIEKGILYVAASLLGAFAFETTFGFVAGFVFLLGVFGILPHYTFSKLFYE